MNAAVLYVNTGEKTKQNKKNSSITVQAPRQAFFHCVKQALKIQELFPRLMNSGLKYDIISAEWGRTTQQCYERGREFFYNGV